MKHGPALCLALALAASPRPALADPPPAARRIPITKPSDLPAHAYTLQGRPSEAVLAYPAMAALATQMEKDVRGDLETYEVQDRATLTSLYTTLYCTAMVRRDFASAAAWMERVRASQENGLAKLLTGVLNGPLIQALQAPGTDPHTTYRALLAGHLAGLPYKDVEVPLDRALKGLKATTREQIVGNIASSVDPGAQGGRLTEDMAGTLLAGAMAIHVTLPMREDAMACLESLFAAHKEEIVPKAVRKQLAAAHINAKGPWFGQALPGETPVLFAPEVLGALSPWICAVTFSPDGKECFVSMGDANYTGGNLFTSTCVDSIWSDLVEAPFIGEFTSAGEAVYSRDGRTVTFTATQGRGASDFFTVTRTASGWSAPVAMPAPIRSDANEFRGSWTEDGTFYFGSERLSPGINQVFKARRDASGGWVVEKLGAPINAMSYDGDPCVAPDGRFIVWYAARAGGAGRVDLQVSFADGKGGWGKPINLGTAFNSPDDEFGAYLTHDGRYMFFNRHTAKGDKLFWVAVSAIDKLRP